MAILARLLEGVSVADIGVLLALVWLVVRLEWTRSENATAHAAITTHIDDVKQNLTRDIDNVKQNLTKHIDDVKQNLTKHIDGVKQDLTRDADEVRQDVKLLLAGDVAWMRAALRDRRTS